MLHRDIDTLNLKEIREELSRAENIEPKTPEARRRVEALRERGRQLMQRKLDRHRSKQSSRDDDLYPTGPEPRSSSRQAEP